MHINVFLIGGVVLLVSIVVVGWPTNFHSSTIKSGKYNDDDDDDSFKSVLLLLERNTINSNLKYFPPVPRVGQPQQRGHGEYPREPDGTYNDEPTRNDREAYEREADEVIHDPQKSRAPWLQLNPYSSERMKTKLMVVNKWVNFDTDEYGVVEAVMKKAMEEAQNEGDEQFRSSRGSRGVISAPPPRKKSANKA